MEMLTLESSADENIESWKLSTKNKTYYAFYLGMISYAGFLTVNAEFDSNLYFWFFPSQSDPSNDPVILWLQVTLHH